MARRPKEKLVSEGMCNYKVVKFVEGGVETIGLFLILKEFDVTGRPPQAVRVRGKRKGEAPNQTLGES